MKRLRLWQTVRGRLLLLAICVELLMLTVLVANSARLLYGAMTRQAAWHAQQVAPILNAALTAPLAQRDYATLQAVLDESRATDGLLYLLVVDRHGAKVASSGPVDQLLQRLPELPSGSGLQLLQHPTQPRYDVAVPVMLSGQRLGGLRFRLNTAQVVAVRRWLLI